VSRTAAPELRVLEDPAAEVAEMLPVGIVDVRGSFDAGDAVEVRGAEAEIGKGICNYSAIELRRVMGLKSREVRELLPNAVDEAVHRDYFVLA
jgi:glutamate 5-kinase